MKAREFDPTKLDVEAFAKIAGSLEGAWPLLALERLAGSAASLPESSVVQWHARGELRPVRGGAGEVWLHMGASTHLMLECQRCLSPVETRVEASRSFLFVHGESTAAELDADSEDDVLALTRSLNLLELVEDELLLSLPLVPRHETCPAPLAVGSAEFEPEEVEAPNPFAALAALKKGSLPN